MGNGSDGGTREVKGCAAGSINGGWDTRPGAAKQPRLTVAARCESARGGGAACAGHGVRCVTASAVVDGVTRRNRSRLHAQDARDGGGAPENSRLPPRTHLLIGGCDVFALHSTSRELAPRIPSYRSAICKYETFALQHKRLSLSLSKFPPSSGPHDTRHAFNTSSSTATTTPLFVYVWWWNSTLRRWVWKVLVGYTGRKKGEPHDASQLCQ